MAGTKSFMGSRYVKASHGPAVAALQKDFRASMDAILGELDAFVADFNEMVPEVMVEALEPTFGKALEYCPVDTGDLRDSGYLEVESQRGKHQAAIGFGQNGQPYYAIYVHELPYHHEAPTRSKFLQSALDEDYWQIVNSIPRLLKERAGA